MKAENPEEAVDEFLGVPALEPEKGDWYTINIGTRFNGCH